MGEYAQAIAVGRATALSAAQEMLHTQRGNDNDDDTTATSTTAQQRQNSPSDWALGAYGSTFVLAPSFSLRLGAEDSLLLRAAIQHDGLAVLLQSELSGRCVITIRAVARAVLCLVLCQAMRPALRPSILVGQDRAHESARSQHPSVHSHSRVPSLPWQARAHSLVRLGLRRGGGARPHRARAPRVDRRERRRQLAQLRGNVDGAAEVTVVQA